MIVNGSSNRCVSWWTQHLQSEVNEDVRVVQSYGLQSDDIHDMLEELMDLARGTRCQNAFYQINMNPAPGERLTEQDWDRARQIAEKAHGLEGQAFVDLAAGGQGGVHGQFSGWSQRTASAISRSVGSTQRSPPGPCSFFQNGARDFR